MDVNAFVIFFSCFYSVLSVPLRDCPTEIQNVGPDENYEASNFVGQWYVLARTRGPWQGHNWAGSVTNFRLNGEDIEGKYSLFMRSKKYRGCIPGMNAILRHTDQSGLYSATLASSTPVTGNYTVYRLVRDFAITYECYQSSGTGCSPNGRVVTLLSRELVAPPSPLLEEMRSLICADEQIDEVDHSVNCSEKIQWPHPRRDIADAVGALNRMKFISKRSIRSFVGESRDIMPADDDGCSLTPCPLPCQSGYVTDGNGCQICECLPDNMCRKQKCKPCKNGYQNDEFGCPSCICKHCKVETCNKTCALGFLVDDEGCDKCECRASESCALSTLEMDSECNNVCPNGRVKDAQGCESCECKCEPNECDIKCDFYAIDEHNCQTCECEDDNISGSGETSIETLSSLEGAESGICPVCKTGCVTEVKNENGCQICECDENDKTVKEKKDVKENSDEECPELECSENCLGPKILDERGCATCDCLKTKTNCSRLNCKIQCERWKIDESGCPICECEEKFGKLSVLPDILPDYPGCPLTEDCPFDCPDGFQNDENGCPTCDCICPQLECWNGPCLHGSKLDKNGCETCDCLRPKRPIMACPFLACPDGPCRTGWWPDRNGCASCTCKCPEKQCDECPNGYKKDEKGCQTCECTENVDPCPPLDCDDSCQTIENHNGCLECVCACKPVNCSSECPNGFKLDKTGCQSCDCLEVVFDHGVPELTELTNEDTKPGNKELIMEDLRREKELITEDIRTDNVRPIVAEDFVQAITSPNGECVQLTCWDGPCLHGSVPDLDDCDTCNCVSNPDDPCPKLDCPEPCVFGSYFDRSGCETCHCRPDPASRCPDLSNCALRCANGFVESNGCKICECFVLTAPDNPCQRVTCDTPCATYKTDENGCRRCECGCSKPVCWNGDCLHGSELDANGCETCNCKRPAVPEISCGLLDCRGRECDHGYAKDRHGCYTCNCAKEVVPYQPKQRANCSEDLSLCPFACMYGHMEIGGCYTCECKGSFIPNAKPCPLLNCDYCEFGYIQDNLGCNTCQCKLPVSELKCVLDCSEVCHYNYVARKDEAGCLQCKCLEAPKFPFKAGLP